MKQIEIEVDCNLDVITIFKDEKEIMHIVVTHPLKFINLFSEILNQLHNLDGSVNHISITKVDEDHKSTEEEW